MAIDMSQFYQVFFEEAKEHLDSMESLLLALDVSDPSLDDLNAILRAAHSIKGGSGTFGFTDMIEVTHVLETLLDRLRKSELQLTGEMIDAFLTAGDVLRTQLEHHQGGPEADPTTIADICSRLHALASGEAPAGPAEPVASPSPATHAAAQYRIECPLAPDLASNDQAIDNLIAGLGELAAVQVEHRPTSADPRLVALLTTDKQADELRDALDFYASGDDIAIHPVGAAASAPAEEEDQSYGFFVEITQEPAAASSSDEGFGFFDAAPGTPVTAPAGLLEEEGFGLFLDAPGAAGVGTATAAPPAAPEVIATTQPAPGRRVSDNPTVEVAKAGRREADKTSTASGAETSIRVSVEKVDQLINLVGELVITQAMLAQSTQHLEGAEAERILAGIDLLSRNTRDLQESVMSIRMLPMSMVFSRFPRVVRDLAGKLGKQVELKTLGENTELDKGLIEKIADPLTHLVRNSLDHGVETPDKRIAAGKPAKGTITLKASHQGGNIMIEVLDDGAGLNRERILNKAKERGLPVHDGMPDQEVWQLIFAPGFSTAEQVTDVSGRGVGMDVVKRNIEGMGGKVELHSAEGFGTRTVISLPLTLAILDGMSVGVGDETYIVPLTLVVESLQPAADDIKTIAGEGRVVHIRGEYLPLIPLGAVFNLDKAVEDPTKGIVMVVEIENGKAALFVDELLGQHQVVIKSLESNYRKVPGVSGATIMGDGRVALILDIAAVARMGLQINRRKYGQNQLAA
ncbi:MAG: chemotaxis protein CheW [Hydrogenophilaceae bacterium]|nr:chemotaxis protein CheW [Hydrogenophilaceae bacterium]